MSSNAWGGETKQPHKYERPCIMNAYICARKIERAANQLSIGPILALMIATQRTLWEVRSGVTMLTSWTVPPVERVASQLEQCSDKRMTVRAILGMPLCRSWLGTSHTHLWAVLIWFWYSSTLAKTHRHRPCEGIPPKLSKPSHLQINSFWNK